MNVEMGMSMFSTEGVIDIAGGLTTVLQVAIFVNLEGMKARLDVLEEANDRCQIVWLLSELKSAAGVRVSEEIELARGNDLLLLLRRMFPVVVDGFDIVGLNITRADGATADPWEAI